MGNLFKTFRYLAADHRGIALLLVIMVVTVVSASMLLGAGLILSNLDSIRARGDQGQLEASLQAAQEALRGWRHQNNTVFDGCTPGDCFSTTLGSCVACTSSDALYNQNSISYRARLTEFAAPALDVTGHALFAIDSIYKNQHLKKNDQLCLNYCAAGGYECGDNGCGGSCGNCGPGETCGGGGNPHACDTGNCSDINIECGDACVEGSICGGGIVIDDANNIVVAPSGCSEGGDTCDGVSEDSVVRQWNVNSTDSAAEDEDDGRTNMQILNPLVNTDYQAAAYCASMTYGGYSWYLPAKNELDDIYATKVAAGLSGFIEADYWSSTDDRGTVDSVWSQQMASGSAGVIKKNNSFNVRCVRRY